jgi:hypothetical protein
MARHVRSEHRFRIAAPADTALNFFTPAGEELWAAGWQPRYLHPSGKSTCTGMVFTTGEGDEFTIWMVADFDRAGRRARYVRTTPASRTGLVEVQCVPVNAGHTDVIVSYEMTALSPQGEASLAGYEGAAFVEMIEGWGRDIGQRLPELLRADIS